MSEQDCTPPSAKEQRKERNRARARELYAANLEKHRAKNKRWREVNAAKFAECVRRSLEKNREKRNAARRARRAANPEKYRAQAKKYLDANREKVNADGRRRYLKRVSSVQVYDRQRRLKNRKYIDDVLKSSVCLRCGEGDHRCLQFHHRIPKEKFAEVARMVVYSRARIVAEIAKCDILCANCHLKAHAHGGKVLHAKEVAS